MLYAGFGARLGALLIDGLILAIPTVLLYLFAAAPLLRGTTCVTNGQTGATSCDVGFGAEAWVFVAVLALAAVVVPIVYFIVPVGRSGQTLGMRVLGIRVVDVASLQPIGLGRSTVRYLVQSFFSGAFCYLGYLWMLWDERNQTWHDKAASSIVIMS